MCAIGNLDGKNTIVSLNNIFLTVIMLFPRNYLMASEHYSSNAVHFRNLRFLTSVCILKPPTVLAFL